MTEKEELQELLSEAIEYADELCAETKCADCTEMYDDVSRGGCVNGIAAGWLLRHGVTVGKEGGTIADR